MTFLIKLDETLEKTVVWVGMAVAWLLIPLVAITIFDVVSRRFFVVGSILLQELEWHIHTFIFAFALGYAYLKHMHVRIDIIRARLSRDLRVWIELIGCVVFLVPWCTVLFYYGYDHALIAWEQGEISSSGMGLSHRWVVKAALPGGLFFLFLAGVVTIIRALLTLFGPAELREKAAAKLEGNNA